jgi:hypothetical protein
VRSSKKHTIIEHEEVARLTKKTSWSSMPTRLSALLSCIAIQKLELPHLCSKTARIRTNVCRRSLDFDKSIAVQYMLFLAPASLHFVIVHLEVIIQNNTMVEPCSRPSPPPKTHFRTMNERPFLAPTIIRPRHMQRSLFRCLIK